MVKTLLIQPIFAPDEARYQRNLASARSLIERASSDTEAFACLFGGWGRPDLIAQLSDFIAHNVPNQLAPPRLFESNIGKAAVTNALYRDHVQSRADIEHLWLIDSDMLLQEPADVQAALLVELANAFGDAQGRPAGLLSLAQAEHNCHVSAISENEVAIRLSDGSVQTVLYPNKPSGIAGGCILVSRAAWEAVEGYRELGVYAGEDGWLVYMIGHAGFAYGVAADIAVVHPYDGDVRYIEWKRDASQTFNHESHYTQSREHADDFWLSDLLGEPNS
jgi:hypothetical protein